MTASTIKDEQYSYIEVATNGDGRAVDGWDSWTLVVVEQKSATVVLLLMVDNKRRQRARQAVKFSSFALKLLKMDKTYEMPLSHTR